MYTLRALINDADYGGRNTPQSTAANMRHAFRRNKYTAFRATLIIQQAGGCMETYSQSISSLV
jgi:hypothetical protein